jgi:hypothetical protein
MGCFGCLLFRRLERPSRSEQVSFKAINVHAAVVHAEVRVLYGAAAATLSSEPSNPPYHYLCTQFPHARSQQQQEHVPACGPIHAAAALHVASDGDVTSSNGVDLQVGGEARTPNDRWAAALVAMQSLKLCDCALRRHKVVAQTFVRCALPTQYAAA